MAFEIARSVLVGILAAAPVGPVLVLIIQMSFCSGRRAGMMGGAGSAFADTLYAAVGLFALSLVQDFIESHQAMIMLVGGMLVGYIGISMVLKCRHYHDSGPGFSGTGIACALKTAGTALSNPTALAVMMALLAATGMEVSKLQTPLWIVLPSVAFGELLYWTVITFILTRVIKRPGPMLLRTISLVAGSVITCFALFLIVKGIMTVCNG